MIEFEIPYRMVLIVIPTTGDPEWIMNKSKKVEKTANKVKYLIFTDPLPGKKGKINLEVVIEIQ